MPDLNLSVEWAINIANDDKHGYDQANRQGPNYDCSSFVSNALANGGFNISRGNTTRTLYNALTSIGFESIGLNETRQKGDIFLKVGHHVIMCINETQIVHASINEKGTTTGGQSGDQTGKEIYIRNFYNYKGGWDYHLRLKGYTPIVYPNPPIIDRVEVRNITSKYYDVFVWCHGDGGISHVYFPTWTVKKGQDDIIWYDVTSPTNGYYYQHIDIAKHNNESGDYITHVYVYDNYGQEVSKALPTVTIKDIGIQELVLLNYFGLRGI